MKPYFYNVFKDFNIFPKFSQYLYQNILAVKCSKILKELKKNFYYLWHDSSVEFL